MSDYHLPYACQPVYTGGGVYVVHVEDHIFHLYPSSATSGEVEKFACSLAARIRLAEHLEQK